MRTVEHLFCVCWTGVYTTLVQCVRPSDRALRCGATNGTEIAVVEVEHRKRTIELGHEKQVAVGREPRRTGQNIVAEGSPRFTGHRQHNDPSVAAIGNVQLGFGPAIVDQKRMRRLKAPTCRPAVQCKEKRTLWGVLMQEARAVAVGYPHVALPRPAAIHGHVTRTPSAFFICRVRRLEDLLGHISGEGQLEDTAGDTI